MESIQELPKAEMKLEDLIVRLRIEEDNRASEKKAGKAIMESKANVMEQGQTCHTPFPNPTRLADPNRVRDARPYTGTLYLIFFFKSRTGTCGYGPHLIT